MNKESSIKIFTIKKSVNDSFSVTDYEATFYTDNRYFVKCELKVGGGIVLDMLNDYCVEFQAQAKLIDDDVFDSCTGHSIAFTKCMIKIRSAVMKRMFGVEGVRSYKRNSVWGKYEQHMENIEKRYLHTLKKVCGK